MGRIGIYGGTFNPPHTGHITAATQAADLLRLDKLLLIPDQTPPHKQIPAGSPSPEQRLEMLRIAAEGMNKLEVSDMELCREGKSYTYETVQELKRMYPNDQLVLIMGTDMFLSFETWKNPDIILEYASLVVLYRGEKGETQRILEKKQYWESKGHTVELVENQIVPISSTQLRRLIQFQCADDYLPAGVSEYILEHGLYGTDKDYRGLPMEELEQVVISLLDPKRVNHVLGCRDTSVELAKHWGAKEEDAARAGLLHDITKALDGPLQLTLCQCYGTILNNFHQKYPKTLHALTGSLVAERIFGENNAVCEAIRHHTTGKADMSLLEKIIYVADYMEPNRDFPGVEKLRELAFTDIDGAVKLGLEMTLAHLDEQGAEVSPESAAALAFLNGK